MHSLGGRAGFNRTGGLEGVWLALDLAKAGGVTGLVYITALCMSVGEEAPPPAPWVRI